MRAFGFAVALCLALPASAQVAAAESEEHDQDELVAQLIHADLPLYTFEWEDLWPRNFYTGEGEDFTFGCQSRVAFGDWEFIPNPIDRYLEGWWIRVENYGVFHCAANFHEADERSELADGDFSRGFFVRLGETRREDRVWELWAIQKGMVPGSDYVLLAREPGDGPIEEFVVLQRRCPETLIRRSEEFDVWTTRYCSINSRSELLAMAESMLALPPFGTLSRISSTNEEESSGE